MENLILDDEEEGGGGGRGGIQRVKILKREITIGFSGSVIGGLCSTVNSNRVFYPLGSTVVARQIGSRGPGQNFLKGHSHRISSLHLSASGKFLATGEADVVGSKVAVVVWDCVSLTALGSHLLHHASVAAVRVSPNDRFVVSAGGEDDASLVVWDVDGRAPLCVGKKSYGRPFVPTCLAFHPLLDDLFFAGGQDAVQIWNFDEDRRKLSQSTVSLGKIKRIATVILVCETSSSDSSFFILLGTQSGDIVKFQSISTLGDQGIGLIIVECAIKRTAKKLEGVTAGKFAGGVTSILRTKSDEFMVGSGDGCVCLISYKAITQTRKPLGASLMVQEPTKSCLKEMKSLHLNGAVTSMCLIEPGTVLVGSSSGVVHQLDTLSFSISKLSDCHTGKINDMASPKYMDRLLGSCGDDGVRLWDLQTGDQVFHACQPCALCMVFHPDGTSVLVGFQDGCLRAFTPQTGRVLFQSQGFHAAGVSALAWVAGGLISGGADGQIRAWRTGSGLGKPTLVLTMREHKQSITNLEVSKDETEFISGSKDGSCIVWDLKGFGTIKRKRILRCSASLIWAKYHPTECQVLTLSSDGQLSYWEVLDGQEIRTIQVGKHSSVSALDISKDGETFVVGDKYSTVKIWRYRQGDMIHLGRAECGEISRVLTSSSHVVAATKYGAIITWQAVPS